MADDPRSVGATPPPELADGVGDHWPTEKIGLPNGMSPPAVGRGRRSSPSKAARGERPGRIRDVFPRAGDWKCRHHARAPRPRVSLLTGTHGRFPTCALCRRGVLRSAIRWMLALVPVWAEHVLPFLVSRTSHDSTPTPPRSMRLSTHYPTNRSRRCSRVTTPSTRRASSSGGRMAGTANQHQGQLGSGLMIIASQLPGPCGDAWEAGADILPPLSSLDDDPRRSEFPQLEQLSTG